ncbi:39S ribosomal protein L54, mitochondrial [Drosophila sechellia]|uniref:Large ribosomal subunit protein mL54 n=1 Tax=Drosophila sechellia TaxID=7238 RepID=B4I7I6_DROSE|nr:39S ribosomal protein L54, mitochondrial [Drosophila sechellia]EDW56561.1 GM15799 [Drosophila sechellia]
MTSLTAVFQMARQRLIAPAIGNWARFYAAKPVAAAGKKKKLGKLGPIMEKKVIPVETDANKLVNYVCGSNYLKTGEDVKIKPDAEYPDWLWTLNTERIIPLDELEPDSKQYWRRLRKLALRRNNQLSKLKKF